jgi:DNA gyrase/topoisomerase IV subunit A
MTIRSRKDVEEGQVRSAKIGVVVTELPHQVYTAAVVMEIAELVEGGTVVGVADIRSEGDHRCARAFAPV